ncbi:outer membrane lipoprotein chaperone LolA [Blochmannia endosymbiont of Polyrhachis (Hedomyrma) turneri]|uniref:outer membrane lipoprotein chaperone LolA n=1 Tax=Blochmannia endosymbiont of Polyrhachis (Hedomyrma) turneri TaxID=1505596 RepID=UPI00061A6252|nr:outer membrane lipoprotein chaperone LolA [Blochmannia endosymbiont of Polyrhachis (Hedomyrma) turneri]AKC59950.1 Outer-membrane lipoprotein carrier protein [Blochmannia endosymbiont of Polyrhachis (Hedomyrma) turneri]
MKIFFVFCVLCLAVIFPTLGDNAIELRTRLNHINSFYAQFVQTISDQTGLILQENNGELWVQHPNLFHYHVFIPEECFLISNGKTLWFYDPYINQVTISWLSDVIGDTFLMLLTSTFDSNWCEYNIDKKNDSFFLVSKKSDFSMFKSLIITVTNQGIIKNFEIVNKDDQHINYQLTNHDIRRFNINTFNFLLPNGVVIDEQRWGKY